MNDTRSPRAVAARAAPWCTRCRLNDGRNLELFEGNSHEMMAYMLLNENPEGVAGKVRQTIVVVGVAEGDVINGKTVLKWMKVLLD
jgi:hypothetical protein